MVYQKLIIMKPTTRLGQHIGNMRLVSFMQCTDEGLESGNAASLHDVHKFSNLFTHGPLAIDVIPVLVSDCSGCT